jgi:hypothetical protein
MALIQCELILTDWKSKTQTIKQITPSRPEVAAEIHSRNNPNCTVDLTYEIAGKQKVISLPPYNMVLDQNLVDEGEMSINRFMTKWYGKISKSKMKAIEEELASEFAEEEL